MACKFFVWTICERGRLPIFENKRHWERDDTFPLYITKPQFPNLPNQNAPGYGPFGTDTDYDLKNSSSGKNASAVADVISGWIAYSKPIIDGKRLKPTSFDYSFWLNGWGSVDDDNPNENPKNVWSLGYNYLDTLTSGISGWDNLTDLQRHSSWYCASGILLNSGWCTEFFNRFNQFITGAQESSFDIDPPTFLIWDLENYFQNNDAPKVFDVGLNDPRVSGELIDGVNTYAEIAASVPSYDPAQKNFHPNNIDFRKWYAGVSNSIADYTLEKSCFAIARSFWPQIKTCEYSLVNASGLEYYEFPVNLTVTGTYLANITHSSPVLYNANKNTQNNDDIQDQLDRLNLSNKNNEIRNWYQINYQRNMHNFRVCVSGHGGDASKVIPWFILGDELGVNRSPFANVLVADLIASQINEGLEQCILFSENKEWADLLDMVDILTKNQTSIDFVRQNQ